MRKTLSIFGYLIIFLIVAQLGATYYVSGIVEEKFRKMQLFLNDNQVISSEIVSFDKGLFKSEIVTNIKFNLLNSIKLCQIKHIIWNGPIIVTGDQKNPIEFQLAVINSYPIEMLDSVNVPFTTRTILNYQGKIESIVEGKDFDIQHEQFKITGTEWKSSIHITPDWLSFKGRITFPETIIHAKELALVIKDLGFNFDQNRSTFGNWLGDVSFTLGNISQKEKALEISNFQFKENSILQDAVIDVVWNVDLEKVGLGGVIYGPVHAKILADNVDAKALQDLSQAKNGLTPERQEDNFRAFLLRRPKITVDQSYLTLPQGSIRINGELSLGGPDITIPLKKEILEQTMGGQVSVVMPKEIFKQILASHLQKEIAKEPDYEKMDEQKRKEELEKQIELKIQKLIQDGILAEKEKNYYDINITIVKGKWTSASGKELTSSPLS